MNEDILDTLKKHHAAMTAGKWEWEAGYGSPPNWVGPTVYAHPELERGFRGHGLNLFGRLDPDTNGQANLDGICALRNVLPAVIEELERLHRIEIAARRLQAAPADTVVEADAFEALAAELKERP